MDDVNNDTNIISILEIQGIKFTTRNFQIEIELKQMMTLNTDKIFENCVIKKKTNIQNNQNSQNNETNSFEDLEKHKNNEPSNLNEIQLNIDETSESLTNFDELPISSVIEASDMSLVESIIKEKSEEEDEKNKEDNIVNKEDNIENKEDSIENKEDNIYIMEENNDNKQNNDLEILPIEIDFDNESLETMTLKKPDQVYYELYKEAREKAKKAKNEAIMAYLEAKNIKKAYMLENIDSSDDSDIENIESELED
jgi:hypothetical protein